MKQLLVILAIFYAIKSQGSVLFSQKPGRGFQVSKSGQIAKGIEVKENFQSFLENSQEFSAQLDEIPFKAVRKNIWIDEQGIFHWEGKIKGDPHSRVNLTSRGGRLSGFLSMGGRHYAIKSFGIHDHVQVRLKNDSMKEQMHAEAMNRLLVKHKQYLGDGLGDPVTTASSDNFIDLMVAYTDDVNAAGSDLPTEIAAAVASVNSMLADSCVEFRYRLVHTEMVNYAETGSFETDLGCIRDSSDGCLDSLHTSRETYGADLVQLWALTDDNLCGIAYVNQSTFDDSLAWSVYGYYCNVSTMAHELGHNIGLTHDRYQENQDFDAVTAYGTGYGFVDLDNRTRSIMAYNAQCSSLGFSCTRINVFSNPNRSYSGVTFGVSGYVDAATTLNQRFPFIANFRNAVSSHSADLSNSACETSSDAKDVHCFVATMAYDSYLHPKVNLFRRFRGSVLMSFEWGRKFVHWYYQNSPKAVFFAEKWSGLKSFARGVLNGVAFILENATSLLFSLVVLGMALLFPGIRILAILGILFLFPQMSSAQLATPSLFDDIFPFNPAVSVMARERVRFLGYSMSTVEFEDSSGQQADKVTESNGNLIFKSNAGGLSYFLDYIIKSEEEFSTTFGNGGEFNGTDEYEGLNFQVAKHLSIGAVGFKYAQRDKESQGGNEEQQVLGLGGGFQFGNAFLGLNFDLVDESGDSLADTKWLEVGLGIGMQAKGNRFEFSYQRAPEVVEFDSPNVTVHGERSVIQLSGESELNVFQMLDQFIVGFLYSKETEASVSGLRDTDIETDLIELRGGFRLLSGKLKLSLAYGFGSRESGTQEEDVSTLRLLSGFIF